MYDNCALKRFMSLQFHEAFNIQFIREPMQEQARRFEQKQLKKNQNNVCDIIIKSHS